MDFSTLNEFILALLAGLTQGLTEFLPISSTAHIRLLTALIAEGRDIGITSSNLIQLGTLLAVMRYFGDDLKRFWTRLREVVTHEGSRTQYIQTARSWLAGSKFEVNNDTPADDALEKTRGIDITLTQLVVGTVPIVVIYIVFGVFAGVTRDIGSIALYLLAGSALMAFGEAAHRRTEKTPEVRAAQGQYMSLQEVLLVGLFQSLAIFPGISRSGATIAGALMLGRPRGQAVRFSFLLSIPAILLAGVWDTLNYLVSFVQDPTLLPSAAAWTPNTIGLSFFAILLAGVAAYFSGLKCLEWLIKYLSRAPVNNFIYYRVGLALIIILLGVAGVV